MKKLLSLFVVIVTLSTFFSAFATSYYCASDGVRVHSEPCNNDNTIGKLNYGQEITVLNRHAGWAEIKFQNDVGYIYEGFIQENGKEWSGQKLGLTKHSAKMKKIPKSNTVTIPKNTIVLITDIRNDIANIKYNGNDGYIKLCDLETKTLKNETCIGAFTITFHQNDSSRSDNIKKAIKKLNGTKVKAGKKFSFFKDVGTNYEAASDFCEDDVTIGGGLSHVATALKKALNSAQRNGCNIRFKEINHFGFTTPYAKKNDEAKVSIEEKMDLIFINKNSYAIRIYAAMRDDSVIILICK